MQKYPIISKHGNKYLVKVYSKYMSSSLKVWCADVYVKNLKPKTLFNRKEFIKIYQWESSIDNYTRWRYKYKDTAIMVVENYELSIQDKIRYETFKMIEEEKWEMWNGVIK